MKLLSNEHFQNYKRKWKARKQRRMHALTLFQSLRLQIIITHSHSCRNQWVAAAGGWSERRRSRITLLSHLTIHFSLWNLSLHFHCLWVYEKDTTVALFYRSNKSTIPLLFLFYVLSLWLKIHISKRGNYYSKIYYYLEERFLFFKNVIKSIKSLIIE